MLRGFGCAVVIFATGCGGSEVDVWLGFPEVATGETLVIVDGPVTARTLTVLEPPVATSEVVIENRPDEAPPVALTFSARASDVGLPQGTLPVVSRLEGRLLFGDPEAYFSDDPREVFELQRRSDPPSASWRPVLAIPSALAALAAPSNRTPCPFFGQPRWGEALPYEKVIVARLDQQRVLVVGRSRLGRDRRWIVDRDGVNEVGDGQRANVIVLAQARLWLADTTGSLWSATPDPSTGWRDPRALDIPSVGAAIEGFATTGTTADIFVGAEDGIVRYYDGRTWTEVGRERVQVRNMVSVAPREALFINADGVLRRATPRGLADVPRAPSSLHSIQVLDGFGPVIGDENGTYFFASGDAWVEALPERFGWFGLSADIYGDGLIALLASGGGVFYSDATGVCEDAFATRFITEGRVVTLGDGVLVVTDVARDEVIDIRWVPGG